MSRALFWKTLRDARLLLVILVLATVAFELLFVIFVREMLQEMLMQIASVWLEKAPFRRMVNSMLGADLAAELTPTSLMAIGFSHPLMYTFMWVLLLTVGTRGLVGEIDRGTADLLLGLPVSRAAVYGSVSATLVLAAVLISVATVCGAGLGAVFIPLKEPINLARLWILVANLLALNLAIAGLTSTSFAQGGASGGGAGGGGGSIGGGAGGGGGTATGADLPISGSASTGSPDPGAV